MEKRIIFFWTAGFFLPAINATVFSTERNHTSKESSDTQLFGSERTKAWRYHVGAMPTGMSVKESVAL
jgi:hypothetical protein